MPELFGPLFRSAFLVNKKSLHVYFSKAHPWDRRYSARMLDCMTQNIIRPKFVQCPIVHPYHPHSCLSFGKNSENTVDNNDIF